MNEVKFVEPKESKMGNEKTVRDVSETELRAVAFSLEVERVLLTREKRRLMSLGVSVAWGVVIVGAIREVVSWWPFLCELYEVVK